MQLSSSQSLSPSFNRANQFADISGKFSRNFGAKMNVKVPEEAQRNQESLNKEEEEEEGYFDANEAEEEQEEEEEEEEEEFSFACTKPDESPIAADDAFQNGQIRTVFPLFNQDLLFDGEGGYHEDDDVSGLNKSPSLRPPLRKLFVEERDGGTATSASEPKGPYCEWSGRTVEEASPEACKKSNSTGFSKLWRFRELVQRSKSDGKDAFVFLNNNNNNPSSSTTNAKASNEKTNNKSEKKEKVEKVKGAGEKAKVKKGKVETAASAHERHYVRNRATKEVDRRKSYLPYRQELVGFFTNVNGLSRNVHPF